MRLEVILCTVIAVRNQLFAVEPYIASVGPTSVKLVYSLGSTIIKVEAGQGEDQVNYSQNQTTKIGSSYYGFVSMSLSADYLNWTLEDFGGQTSTCTTLFQPKTPTTTPTDVDACAATGCFPSFQEDGWCDSLCLNTACGFDGTDCEDADVFEVLECDPKLIGNGICNKECAGPLTFYDGGDCMNPCLRTGCPRLSLGNGICDQACNNEACSYDRGDCASGCSPGCGFAQVGNGVCDEVCNTSACDYDSGDCSETGLSCPIGSHRVGSSCEPYDCISLGCTGAMLNNYVCDLECDNPYCNYDGGHCIDEHLCLNHGCSREDDIDDGHCDMECFYDECAYDLSDCRSEVCWTGCLKQFVGNGICDEACNVPQCNFDGGDCKSSLCAESCFTEWLGDGVCDPDCNYANCQYDNGDCSGSVPGASSSPGSVTIGSVVYQVTTQCIRSTGILLVLSVLLLL